MENNSQSRTLYFIQLFIIVILILLLIVQALPFFGIIPPGKGQYQILPKNSSGPVQYQNSTSPHATSALSIPHLVLQ
jgi:hypothetical protein